MLMEFMSPGLVQLHALQYMEQALRVRRETPLPERRRPLRKVLGRVVGYGRLLAAGLTQREGRHETEPRALPGRG